MSDVLACGRRFRPFNVVDDFNHESLHIEADTSITSKRRVRIFEQLQRDHGHRYDARITTPSSLKKSQAANLPVKRGLFRKILMLVG